MGSGWGGRNGSGGDGLDDTLFHLAHTGGFGAGDLVVVAREVEDAVHHEAAEFRVEGVAVLHGLLARAEGVYGDVAEVASLALGPAAGGVLLPHGEGEHVRGALLAAKALVQPGHHARARQQYGQLNP